MTGLDCTVLYNPAVSVTSTHYVGSRLYIYCTTLQYLWLVHNMMALACTTLKELYKPAVPATGTHYDGFKLDYCTVLELDKWGSMNTSLKPRDLSKID